MKMVELLVHESTYITGIKHTCDISRFRRELPVWSLFSRSHSRETKSPDERFSNFVFFFRTFYRYFCPNILSFTAIIYLAGKCLTIDTC